MGSRVLYRVSIIIRVYNLGYWIWHISAGFCFESIKSIKLTSNCLLVAVLGGLFFCTESCEKKVSLLGVYCEDGQILEQIVCGISFCGDIECLIGLCPAQPALTDAA